MKDLIFLLIRDKRNCIGSISVNKIVPGLFRTEATWQLESYRGSVTTVELFSLNFLEFVSPEPQPWSQSFGLHSARRIFVCDVFTFLWCCCSLCSGEIFKHMQWRWKWCVKNSKAASLTFTLTVVTAWNGKFFDPCWKKGDGRTQRGIFYHVGWTFLL